VEAHGGALRVSTVEHVFSALAGLGIYSDVMIVVDGPELPLLDGGAAAWCEAIATLCVAPRKPFLRVMREWVVDVGPSRYELTPGDCVEVEARIVIEDARVAAEAHWAGDASDYRARIAPARTFAVAANLEELARRGLARQVDPTSVVVLAPDAIHHSGRPFSSDEPARHKLLDLIGDLYLHGGPPIGRVRAVRPGHSANAQFIRRAIHAGAITRLRP
jgi:UDP-3-O-[3-hydroxymyristoyl] N-acetylglucosamine deacetylase